MRRNTFPIYKQLNAMDCGPTCLRMIAKYYGRHYNADTIRQKMGFNKQGVSLLGISDTAEKLGFRTRGVQIAYDKLFQVDLPAILHWDQNHFVVLTEVNKKSARVADPAKGVMMRYKKEEFLQHWLSNNSEDNELVGTILLIEPTGSFLDREGEKENKLTWGIVTQYLRQSKAQIIQVFISLLVGLVLQMILPFLTQSMVDTGINTHNMQYISLVLIAQLTLTFSNAIVGFLRSRLQLRISNNINISILSDFWIKLTRLPLAYFDSRHTGDTMQRIGDNRQVQSFLTGQALTTIFSTLSFFVYAFILIFYSLQLFIIFLAGNIVYFLWIKLFMRIRRKINYETFHLSAKENNATLQMVQGMQEIRLNNGEQLKRWDWENIQAQVFKLNFKSLNYGQWQSTGALFISQGKDIMISFITAQLVVQGELTFGTMLAIQYIIGQLNGPVQQFTGLAQSIQDAKISMERLNEIHSLQDEEPADRTLNFDLPKDKSIHLNQLSFKYPSAGTELVLENINLIIPEGKVTAIVGASGSGKTTLLKLLLKIYEQYDGEISVGENNFKYISPSFWRRQCGAVLQDGYVFNDSIARNIVVGDQYIDFDRLKHSCHVANIISFVDSLPNGFNTKLGAEGVGISQGQRQRLLIARAVYKDPHYLLFDEATNSLDANNEKTIVENLNKFFANRTVVVVAHRLSTVRNADKIVVLDKGKIAEEGTHDYLTSLKGRYYELVKNQLELGQ